MWAALFSQKNLQIQGRCWNCSFLKRGNAVKKVPLFLSIDEELTSLKVACRIYDSSASGKVGDWLIVN